MIGFEVLPDLIGDKFVAFGVEVHAVGMDEGRKTRVVDH